MSIKRILNRISVVVFFGIILSYGISQLSQDNVNNNSAMVSEGPYMPGELFYENGWTGWIDPKLTNEPVPKANKETAKWKGSVVKEGNTTYISCPSKGTKCGRLYTVGAGGITYVGLYLDD